MLFPNRQNIPRIFAQEVGEVLFIVGLRGCRGGMGGAYAGTQTGSHFCSAALLPGCQNRVPSISEGKIVVPRYCLHNREHIYSLCHSQADS